MSVRELFAYLRVRDAARAIEFYRQAFGATEKFRLAEPTVGPSREYRGNEAVSALVDWPFSAASL